MADPSSPIAFEDMPLDEARRMTQGPRMDAEIYHALKEKIQALDITATRIYSYNQQHFTHFAGIEVLMP